MKAKYLGLDLSSPVVVSSSPYTATVSNIEQCVRNGAGAVVLKSIFEEQIYRQAASLDRMEGYGDAGEYLRERANKGVHFDAVIMDPARAGADKQFLRALSVIRPERVVYISCNPVTLARDLRTLSKHYDIGAIQPFDMFPFTRHVECVVAMSRKAE